MDFELNDEQKAFQDATRRWVEKEIPKSWARELERDEHHYPFALWDKFTAAGFHGIGIDERYGGQGGDVVIQMLLARELARPLGGLAMVWGITSFAGGKCLSLFGTDAQKQRFLPEISAGRLRAAVSITEPGGGTDVLGALRTSAVRVPGGWELSGGKIWSSSSHVADYLLVLARTDPAPAKRHQGLTLFYVPAKQPGITITPLGKLGMRALGSCTVSYDRVFVPDDLVLGEPGRGWRLLMPTINNERIMVGAFCLGVLDGILEDALAYAKERVAFGRPIGQYQSIQHYIADIATWRQQIELQLLHTAWLESTGRPCDVQTNMLKLAAGEYANRAADLGIQILGGMGYSADTDMQRYWRDSRLWRIGPVTDEMTRNGIAEQLGLPRSY